MTGLTKAEIIRIVNSYLGVEGGYLADFSYRTHREFYPTYCDLDIDPEIYDGTTRYRFIQVLENSQPNIQAKILAGVLEKYPPGSDALRTNEKAEWIRGLIERTSDATSVEHKITAVTSEIVEKAIADAESLIRNNGVTSGVDRIHTAFHGYLIALCDANGIAYDDDPSITSLFRLIRENHPAFSVDSPHAEHISRIVRSLSGAIDALNMLRNRGSLSHPNRNLLERAEALLYINATRTILAYIDSKIVEWERALPEIPF